MARELTTEALVLDRVPAGERHTRLRLLSPDAGLLAALLREPGAGPAAAAKKSPAAARAVARPDVFDHATVTLDAPKAGAGPGAVHFVREYRVLRRHAGLARRYAALEAAAALAQLVTRHAAHFETCAPVFALLVQVLAALEDGAPPEAVRLKALFRLARAEGYAAREHWLPALAESDRALVVAVLNQPAAATALPAAAAAHLPRLRRAFERWLAEHTDLETGQDSAQSRP